MADIEAATLEDVEEFFQTYYVPNNAVLTVCGDFGRDEALDLIERHFGEIPKGGEIPAIPGEPNLDSVIGGTVRERVEAEVPLPRVLVASRAPPYTDDDFYAADIAGSVLGSGRASRLYRSLVRERRVAKDVTSFVLPLTSGAGMVLVWATGFPEGDPAELEAALVEEIEGLTSVTEQEIQRAVALTETALVRQIEQVGERADLLSMFDQLFDDPERLNGELERLRAVTPSDVSTFVERFLGTDNRAVLTYVPEPAKTPTPSGS
jgi:predicted Zn-dependent peptidase